MSFLKKLFGLGSSGSSASAQEEEPGEDYNGYHLRPAPFEEKGGFQVCGVITRTINGEEKKRVFIRADRLPSREAAISMTMAKARQIVDLEGDRIFRQKG